MRMGFFPPFIHPSIIQWHLHWYHHKRCPFICLSHFCGFYANCSGDWSQTSQINLLWYSQGLLNFRSYPLNSYLFLVSDRRACLFQSYVFLLASTRWGTGLPVWDDILTPTIFWPRGQNIVTIYWPPLRYFDLPINNQWQSFILLLLLLDEIYHLIIIILMNF